MATCVESSLWWAAHCLQHAWLLSPSGNTTSGCTESIFPVSEQCRPINTVSYNKMLLCVSLITRLSCQDVAAGFLCQKPQRHLLRWWAWLIKVALQIEPTVFRMLHKTHRWNQLINIIGKTYNQKNNKEDTYGMLQEALGATQNVVWGCRQATQLCPARIPHTGWQEVWSREVWVGQTILGEIVDFCSLGKNGRASG